MPNRLRIGYGGVGVESSSFTPIAATKAAFRQYRGAEVVSDWLLKPAAELEVELVPLFFAGSTPSGVVPSADWCELKGEFIESLRAALPLDGLLVRAHGATVVDRLDSGELDLFRGIRSVVGPNLPISWAADLHGNIPDGLPALATIVTAYRTAPHKDGIETIVRGLRLLVECIRSGKQIFQAHVRVPVLFPGEKVITEVEPGKSLYAEIDRLIRETGIVDCSIFVGFGWADTPHAGASVVAFSDRSLEHARAGARTLAEAFWKRREDFAFEGMSLKGGEALNAADAFAATVFISDSGDNISAGAPGDSIYMLKLMVEQGRQNCIFAPLIDEPAAEICAHAGEGAEVTLSLGGTLSSSESITLTGQVRRVVRRPDDIVVVFESGGIEIVILSKRGYFHMPAEYQGLRIDLLKKRIVVLKLGYLYPELRAIAPHSIMCLSPGPSGLILEDFSYKNLTRPIFPFDMDSSDPYLG